MLFLTKHHIIVMLNYKSIVCTGLCMSVNVGIRKYLCVINTYKISSWHYNIHEQEQWQQFHWTVSIIIPSMSAVAQCVVNTPCMVKSMVRRWHMGSWCPTLWGADCMGLYGSRGCDMCVVMECGRTTVHTDPRSCAALVDTTSRTTALFNHGLI